MNPVSNTELALVKQLIDPSTSQLNTGGNENINSGINLALLLIKQKTRGIMYPYALRTQAGNINFYGLIPMKLNDPDETNLNYKARTVWLSFSFNSQPSKQEGVRLFYNQNAGIVKTFLTPFHVIGDQKYHNPYNKLNIAQAKLHQYIVPSNIDAIGNERLVILKAPFNKLKQRIAEHTAQGLTGASLVEMNTVAFNEYIKEVEELYKDGLLTLSTILTTPKPNSIELDIGVDETADAQSNPWLSANFLLNQENVDLSSLPITNSFRGLIQVTEADMSVLNSDNVNMFGKRIMNKNPAEGEIPRFALSKVGMIKDYGINTPVLVSIIDAYSNDTNAKSRVDTFETFLANGVNMFNVEGTIKPIARLTSTNSGRSGNVFFEISIDQYSPYNSTSLTSSLEHDDYRALSFDADEALVATEEVNFGSNDDSNELANASKSGTNKTML